MICTWRNHLPFLVVHFSFWLSYWLNVIHLRTRYFVKHSLYLDDTFYLLFKIIIMTLIFTLNYSLAFSVSLTLVLTIEFTFLKTWLCFHSLPLTHAASTLLSGHLFLRLKPVCRKFTFGIEYLRIWRLSAHPLFSTWLFAYSIKVW